MGKFLRFIYMNGKTINPSSPRTSTNLTHEELWISLGSLGTKGNNMISIKMKEKKIEAMIIRVLCNGVGTLGLSLISLC